jgi:hypothetical protein
VEGKRCSRYEPANPEYVETWVSEHTHLVDADAIGAWIEQACERPESIESQPMPGTFGIYGYRTALIEGQDVDVVFVWVENSCELYIRKLTHVSEIEDDRDSFPFPEHEEPPSMF